MDLSKASEDTKLYLCRWYFKIGFAFLPFIWVVNIIWFFDEAFRKPPSDGQRTIRKLVLLSSIGALIWAVGLFIWMVIFQANRVEWGEFADNLSFIIPLGKA